MEIVRVSRVFHIYIKLLSSHISIKRVDTLDILDLSYFYSINANFYRQEFQNSNVWRGTISPHPNRFLPTSSTQFYPFIICVSGTSPRSKAKYLPKGMTSRRRLSLPRLTRLPGVFELVFIYVSSNLVWSGSKGNLGNLDYTVTLSGESTHHHNLRHTTFK